MLCLSISSIVFAAAPHKHADTNVHKITGPAAKTNDMQYPGFCQIEIINTSHELVRVYGIFDDGTPLDSFLVYDVGAISLFYYGYCHAGMTLFIDTYWGIRIYSGYTTTYSTVYVFPYMEKMPKISVAMK